MWLSIVPLLLFCDVRVNQAAKGANFNHSTLVNLLESTEHFLKRVEIYKKITPTPATDESMFKILVDLLSTLALATKEFKLGRSSESVVANVLLYSAQCSQISKERTEHRGSPTETRQTHARRGPDYRRSDSWGHPQPHPEYDGSRGG
jgi:hypothetical protein